MSVATQLRQFRDETRNAFLLDIDNLVAKSVGDLWREANTIALPMFNRPNQEAILTITGTRADELAEAYKYQCSSLVGTIKEAVNPMLRAAEESCKGLNPEKLLEALNRQFLPGIAGLPSEY